MERTSIFDNSLLKDMELSSCLGKSVSDLSYDRRVMMIFLRHFGCMFCRETLRELAKNRAEIESFGFNLVLVHMARNDVAEQYFEEYQLPGIDHVSDPDCTFYGAFGLGKGNFSQLFGLRNWIRGASMVMSSGPPSFDYDPEKLGDPNQMPGIFIIERGNIKMEFIYRFAGDKPDYKRLAKDFCTV